MPTLRSRPRLFLLLLCVLGGGCGSTQECAGGTCADAGEEVPDASGPRCVADGRSCIYAESCCSGICDRGVCARSACIEPGGACGPEDTCCLGLCSGGRCGAPQGCGKSFANCGPQAACCPGLQCFGNTCRDCAPRGQPCSTEVFDCCGGSVCLNGACVPLECTATDEVCSTSKAPCCSGAPCVVGQRCR